MEFLKPQGWDGDGEAQGVDDSPQHALLRCPCHITIMMFIQGFWLLPNGLSGHIGPEDLVDRVKEKIADPALVCRISLHY